MPTLSSSGKEIWAPICAHPCRAMASLVSYSLLQQEEPTAMAEALNFHLAFGILKSALDCRACPHDL